MLAIEAHLLLRTVLAAVIGGAVCGVVGVWVVMLGIPFVGVAMSHSAFAGAICGLLLGINPLITALVFAFGAALVVGPVAERADMDPGVSLGVVFSFMLGLAFLGIGLLKGPRTEVLRFMWGNVLLVSWWDVVLLAVVLVFLLGFLFAGGKEIKAVLFNREIARAVGVPERAFFFLLLFFAGLVVTVNLNTIGGLLVFSLVVSPAAAAYQLTYRLKMMYLLSVGIAVGSALVGFLFSWFFNLSAGATIICVTSFVFALALIFSPKRRRYSAGS